MDGYSRMREKLLPKEMVGSMVSVETLVAAVVASNFGEIELAVVGGDKRSFGSTADLPSMQFASGTEVDGKVAGGDAEALITVVVVVGRSRRLMVAEEDM
jgi:protein gp37